MWQAEVEQDEVELLALHQLQGDLAVLGRLQRLSQACSLVLHGEQDALALFVLADALLQLGSLLGQPRLATSLVLIEQLGGQRMGFELRTEAVLLDRELLLLLQQFFLLGDQAADFGAQLTEFFLELIDGQLRAGLFVLVMPAEALQQGFRLMIGMLGTAAHRARLVVLQLCAQLLDTGAASQALALKQFSGDLQGLLGEGQFGLGLYPVSGQAFAFAVHAVQAFLQRLAAAVQLLLTGPQTGQLFDRPQLFAIVLQQAAEDLHLFGDRRRLDIGLAVEHRQLLALQLQLTGAVAGPLLQGQQLGLALFQAIAHLHQLLQALAMQAPGVADRCQVQAVFQLAGDARQLLGGALLLFEHLRNRLLAVEAGLFGAELVLVRGSDGLDQPLQIGLFGKCLAQARGIAAVLFLSLEQRGFGAGQAHFELGLTGLMRALLAAVLLDLCRQRV